MAISQLVRDRYDKVAKVREEIVKLLDDAFEEGYVVVVGYCVKSEHDLKAPELASGWWNKRFVGAENPAGIRRLIFAAHEAQRQMDLVRAMPEWDAFLLYEQTYHELGTLNTALNEANSRIIELVNSRAEIAQKAMTITAKLDDLEKSLKGVKVTVGPLRVLKPKPKRKRKKSGHLFFLGMNYHDGGAAIARKLIPKMEEVTGDQCTARWPFSPSHALQGIRASIALTDALDVARSNYVVLVPLSRTARGLHVEMGLAFGLDKPCYLFRPDVQVVDGEPVTIRIEGTAYDAFCLQMPPEWIKVIEAAIR